MLHDLLQWLLKGDASIRYQTARDLLDSPKEEIKEHQMYIEIEGWGRQLLDLQDSYGLWDNNLVDPEWTATLWTLTTLRRMGIARDSIEGKLAANLLLEKGIQRDGGINYSEDNKDSEVCESALVLSALSYFRIYNSRRDAIFEYLIETQMGDGGWNCKYKESNHSSFHTTLVVLEALREYSRVNKGNISFIKDLQTQAQETLLYHRLYFSHSSGEVADFQFAHFYFPNYWKYDVLAALDYFQSIDHPYDARFIDAINLLKEKETENGWDLELRHKGNTWFDMEEMGEPSRWNTLRSLRVLQWWERVAKYK